MLNIFRKAILTQVKDTRLVLCSYFSTGKSPSVAVVLSGCGVNDGSEIHEVVSILSHVTRNNAIPCVFAPDKLQVDVIDHYKCKPESGSRNVLVEAARIARSQISPLSDLIKDCSKYDAVLFPGGFGVAKNLSDFASKGPDCVVINEVVCVLQEFHKAKKPIGLCCIAPILAAKVFPGVTITLGKDGDEKLWPFKSAIEAATAMGAKIEKRDINEVTIDKGNQVYSTPAFMYSIAKYHEVDDGIGNMVKCVIDAVKK